MTQSQIMEKMGVNGNSFYKFMNPKSYKDQWSATQNGTYWAAAKLLEQVKYDKERAKQLAKLSGKRKSDDIDNITAAPAAAKKSKSQVQLEALQLIQRIHNIEGVPNTPVYDSCPQLVKKMKSFLERPGMTKSNLCLALGSINGNSLNTFLAGKGQDQCGNVAYRNGYVFFEKLRLAEGREKTRERRKNEMERPGGFALEKARPARVVKWLPPHFMSGW
jgi:hypothetical protein